MIEKNLFQTAPNLGALPYPLIKNIEYLKTNNPDWNYKFYNQREMLQAIKDFGFDITRINPEYQVALADIFRYIVIYRYGGVYLDIKSSSLVPLDEVVKDKDEVFVKWPPMRGPNNTVSYVGENDELIPYGILGGELINWFIAAKKGSPYLQTVLEYVEKNINSKKTYVGKPGVLRLTGPVPYTLAVFHHGKYEEAVVYRKLKLKYSVLMDHKSHFKIFGKHYSELTSSILK